MIRYYSDGCSCSSIPMWQVQYWWMQSIGEVSAISSGRVFFSCDFTLWIDGRGSLKTGHFDDTIITIEFSCFFIFLKINFYIYYSKLIKPVCAAYTAGTHMHGIHAINNITTVLSMHTHYAHYTMCVHRFSVFGLFFFSLGIV